MRKTRNILLMLILSVFIFGQTVSAYIDLNVVYDEDTKTASISGAVDEEAAGAVMGLYITQKDAQFGFSSEGSTEAFISLQNTVVGNDGSFAFEDVNLKNAEGDIDFTVSVISDALSEDKTQSISIPTQEAADNFFELLDLAQSGADVLALINANIDGTTIDGKDVNIGLKGDIYNDYPELTKQAVADIIFAALEDNEGTLTVTSFKKLHTDAALTCAFVNCDTWAEALEFINVEKEENYYKEITSALNLEKLKKNSVVKRLIGSDEDESNALTDEKKDDLVAKAKGSLSLDAWLEVILVDILNDEMSDATDSLVPYLIETYKDMFTALDFANYDALLEYRGDISAAILAQKPYASIKNFCDVANAAITTAAGDKEAAEDEDTSSDEPSDEGSNGTGNGGTGGGGGGGNFKADVVPAPKPDPIPETKPEPQPAFNDMKDAQWAQEAVEALYEKKVINGKAEGMFCPNDNITREEFVKILVLAFDVYNPDAKCEFTDAPEDAWYYTYAASAFESGFVNGISENEFGTGKNITREDAATMIYRVLKEVKEDLVTENELKFADREEISAYAAEAVSTLAEYGVINGISESEFSPKGMCTRAQVAKMIYEASRR